MGLKSILNSLLRRKVDAAPIGHNNGPSLDPPSNSFAIPVPEGYPPELLVRVPLRQPRDPSRKGKRRTKEEIVADHEAWLDGTMRQARLRFDFERRRAEAIGITHYRWRAADHYGCALCRERDGQIFALREPPEFQHPGLLMCVSDYDYGDDEEERGPETCRCYYEMIFPE